MADVKLRAPGGDPQTIYFRGDYVSTDENGVITVPSDAIASFLRAGFTFVVEQADVAVAENQLDSTAEDVPGLVADFNSLLAKLKAAGFMAADPEA